MSIRNSNWRERKVELYSLVLLQFDFFRIDAGLSIRDAPVPVLLDSTCGSWLESTRLVDSKKWTRLELWTRKAGIEENRNRSFFRFLFPYLSIS